ncbi:hypothetical protein CDAR_600401 [Caerostris darwini]|uniref:Uncharacterized protein n=1 Tax=Caerostris darwini TaxID=1538125 RepID=A0AAV4TY74_9ARAC|nr:hypothetical protein CDAR_600401 [Caerostris darwini]
MKKNPFPHLSLCQPVTLPLRIINNAYLPPHPNAFTLFPTECHLARAFPPPLKLPLTSKRRGILLKGSDWLQESQLISCVIVIMVLNSNGASWSEGLALEPRDISNC